MMCPFCCRSATWPATGVGELTNPLVGGTHASLMITWLPRSFDQSSRPETMKTTGTGAWSVSAATRSGWRTCVRVAAGVAKWRNRRHGIILTGRFHPQLAKDPTDNVWESSVKERGVLRAPAFWASSLRALCRTARDRRFRPSASRAHRVLLHGGGGDLGGFVHGELVPGGFGDVAGQVPAPGSGAKLADRLGRHGDGNVPDATGSSRLHSLFFGTRGPLLIRRARACSCSCPHANPTASVGWSRLRIEQGCALRRNGV